MPVNRGGVQVFARSSKFALFDPAKEMVRCHFNILEHPIPPVSSLNLKPFITCLLLKL